MVAASFVGSTSYAYSPSAEFQMPLVSVTSTKSSALISPKPPPAKTGYSSMLPSYLLGVATTAISIPSSLYLSSYIGTLSNNLYASTLPSLLSFALLPPLITNSSEHLMHDDEVTLGTHFNSSFWAGLGTHMLFYIAGVMLGVSTQDLGKLSAFTSAEAIVLPAVITWMMYRGRAPTSRIANPTAKTQIESEPIFDSTHHSQNNYFSIKLVQLEF